MSLFLEMEKGWVVSFVSLALLFIYSRNGDHVFQSRQIENGWDGRRKGTGEILPQGVYVYTVKFKTVDHKSGIEKGQILLIR